MRYQSITRASILAPLAMCAGLAANANCSSGSAAKSGTESSSSSGSSSSSSGAADAGVVDTFQADPPAVYVAKVKNLLVGLPPTNAEVQQVTADPAQLRTLIGQWQQLPEYTTKMETFFEQAFQQTQITQADFVNLFPRNGISTGMDMPYLTQNVIESFARTVLAMNKAGTPFTQSMTTTTVMMTPPLMELYAFLDTYHVDDNDNITDTFAKDYPGVDIMQGSAYAAVTPAESIDPTSPDFMHWPDVDPKTLVYNPDPGGCTGLDPIVYYTSSYDTLQWILYGAVNNHPPVKGSTLNCGSRNGTTFGQFTAADFGETAWKMVTIRAPKSGEATTKFFDIPTLRSSSELVLNTPHPGFFSTPAFFTNWSTNQSNQMRVTANQALIVGTGAQVDGTDPTTLAPAAAEDAGLDATHAAPGSACYGCHQLLDPTRAILSSTYSYAYYQQLDPTMIAQKGLFAFQGVESPVSSVADFGNALATHKLFPGAWAQKLCYYANSAPCLTTNPEFQRIVNVFVTSGYSWDTLVAELFSSPLTTNAAPTATTAVAEVVSVSRRDHLCAALDIRLGLNDICGLSALTSTTTPTIIPEIAAGLPSDGYGRGATIPVLPNSPTLFYRAGVENICEAVATLLIDPPATNTLPAGAITWKSTAYAAAIADFVATIMAITPSDPRSAEAQAALTTHYNNVLASKPTPPSTKALTPTQALQSTFVAACLSPSFVGIGM